MKKDKKLVEVEEEFEVEEVPYSVLSEKELKLKKEKEKEKAKKKGKRGLALFLSLVALGSVGYGAKKVYDGSDLKFSKEVQTAYVQCMDTLRSRYFDTVAIKGFRFFEPTTKDGSATVEVFSTYRVPSGNLTYIDTTFEVVNKYYKALKEAEDGDDVMAYIEALNECFKNMQFKDEQVSYTPLETTFNEEETIKFNEMFSLKNEGLNQIGFLPQFVDLSNQVKLEDGSNDVTYTFKGYSFVRVNKGEGYDVLPSDMSNAILTEKLDAKNIDDDIKVYEVTYEWKYNSAAGAILGGDMYIFTLKQLFNNGEFAYAYVDYGVTPTFVREVELTNYKLQTRNFDFNKAK